MALCSHVQWGNVVEIDESYCMRERYYVQAMAQGKVEQMQQVWIIAQLVHKLKRRKPNEHNDKEMQ